MMLNGNGPHRGYSHKDNGMIREKQKESFA